jgi:hypothetical protein
MQQIRMFPLPLRNLLSQLILLMLCMRSRLEMLGFLISVYLDKISTKNRSRHFLTFTSICDFLVIQIIGCYGNIRRFILQKKFGMVRLKENYKVFLQCSVAT